MNTDHPAGRTDTVDLSVIVPLMNEADNVAHLHRRLVEVLDNTSYTYELIFIDDGSTDGTYEKMKELSPVVMVRFRRNFGQTAAFDAGIKQARGSMIVTMDGDLQNDPGDIPDLITELNNGYDAVSGWRYDRHDTFSKRLTSRAANLLRKLLFQDNIHDSGCGLKVYRRECFANLDLFGEIHRFIPALLATRGFRVSEVKVHHYPRTNGVSKYDNIQRGMKSLVDMVSIWFWDKYGARPLHLFGTTGFIMIGAGILVLAWMAFERIVLGNEISERIWPLIGIFFLLMGAQSFMIGLLTELNVRNYFRTHRHMNYHIREITQN